MTQPHKTTAYSILASTFLAINLLATIDILANDQPQAPDYEAFAELRVPPLPPEKALEKFTLEEGFRIELVAHEPQIIDPVAMDIDANGRLWVVEMPTYMPVHDKGDGGTSQLERVPGGRVVVLEDTNGDGRMDKSHVFRDELTLPRAIKVLDDGILVATPPHIWHIQDTNGDGIGDSKTEVFDRYGNPNRDNVEHMPNGLMWGMDNWIYSSHGNAPSLRRIDGRWQTRSFPRLGQWGMTQDNYGRLYSSHNTNTLLTHYNLYAYHNRHPNAGLRNGLDRNTAESERMWPAHFVGVNRGYRDNEVDDDGVLRRSTATAGPVIYRGGQFGDDYKHNAFIPEPAGNLIKRLILEYDPAAIDRTVGKFAYQDKEFLTSTDERFRPVNMYNAPDGSLYVVDMYRGIFQHARFLTEFLRNHAVEHGLHEPVYSHGSQFGRIYRIVRDDQPINYETPKLGDMEPLALASYLRSEHGQLRDTAQQLLVQRSPEQPIEAIESLAISQTDEPYVRIHALWSLEGYDRSVYSVERLATLALKAVDDPHPRVRAAAIHVLEPAIAQNNPAVLNKLDELSKSEEAPYVRLQLLASLGESGHSTSLQAMARIINAEAGNNYFREIALTGLHGRENIMASILRNEYDWSEEDNRHRKDLLEKLAELQQDTPEIDLSHLDEEQQQLFHLGSEHYAACMACHGADGEGLEGVATPLAGSEWVKGDPRLLTLIALHGFADGEVAKELEITNVMPAHGHMADEELAGVLTYIRQSWGNEAEPIKPDLVKGVRNAMKDRKETWTPDELKKLLD